MRILHTSDWHLGIELHKLSMIDDQRFFLKQLKQIIIDENIDVILISGDIYDTTLATQEAIALFNEAMNMLCLQLHKYVIIIAGNHDSAVRLCQYSDFLKHEGLYIYGKIEQEIKPLIIEECAFYPIPYFHLETINRVYKKRFRTSEEALSHIVDTFNLSSEVKNIAMAHLFVQGATICDSDRSASIGGSDVVSASVFEKFDYVALGHLHRPQTIHDHVRYSGSPLPYSFSEANYEKTLSIYDSDTSKITQRTYPILHRLRNIEGTYQDVMDGITKDLNKDDYIRITLSDTIITFELLQYIREFYPHLLQLNGLQAWSEQTTSTIDINQIDTLQDEDILRQFFQDYFNEDISEYEQTIFNKARNAIEEYDI